MRLLVVIDYCSGKRLALALRTAIEMRGSLKGRAWHGTDKVLQQIAGIGKTYAKTLFDAGICSISDLQRAGESRIEVLLRRNPPFGHAVRQKLAAFPALLLEAELNATGRVTMRCVTTERSAHIHPPIHLLALGMCDVNKADLLLHETVSIEQLQTAQLRTIQIARDASQYSCISCHLLSANHAGVNQCVRLDTGTIATVASAAPLFKDDSLDHLFDVSFEGLVACQPAPLSEQITLPATLPTNVKLTAPAFTTTTSARSVTEAFQSPPITPAPLVLNRPSVSTCKHSCKNKRTCAHSCCKSGSLEGKRLFASQGTNAHEPPVAPMFARSRQHSLADARRFLKRYRLTDSARQQDASPSTVTSTLLLPASQWEEIEFVTRYMIVAGVTLIFVRVGMLMRNKRRYFTLLTTHEKRGIMRNLVSTCSP